MDGWVGGWMSSPKVPKVPKFQLGGIAMLTLWRRPITLPLPRPADQEVPIKGTRGS